MNTPPQPRNMSFVSRVLVGLMVALLCLVGALSYAVLDGGQRVHATSRSTSREIASFIADARTVMSAISYVLESEIENPSANLAYRQDVSHMPSSQPG